MKKTDPIKARLNAHLDMLDKLDTIKLEIQHVYGTMKSPSFSGMPSGSGGKRTSEEERLYQRKEELEKKAKRQQAEIDRDWAELEPMVEQLKPIGTLIMNLRYRYGNEWEDVCNAIFGRRSDYDVDTKRYMDKMFKAHGRALLELADMMKQ